MVTSWKLNLFIGLFGFLLVFLISFRTNTIETTFIRGLLAFASFYLFGFVVKWVITYVLSDTNTSAPSNQTKLEANAKEQTSENNPNDQMNGISDKQSASKQTEEMFQKTGTADQPDVYERTSDYVRELLDED